jgi:predicted regulator of amino acid metabolism with ACT domain
MTIASFLHGQNVSVTVQCKDVAGNPLSATAAEYDLLDANGNVIVSDTAVPGFTPGNTSATVQVTALQNSLEAGEKRDMRVVRVTFTTTSGTVQGTERYMITAEETLEVMFNTFQTYDHAELIAAEMTGLNVWHVKTEAQKRAALADAFYGLSKLRFRIPNTVGQDRVNYPDDVITNIRELTVSEFNALEEKFLQALKRAQVAEADSLLENNQTDEMRRRGIISYTIGETSQFMGSQRPLDLTVNHRSIKYLTGYISWALHVARA